MANATRQDRIEHEARLILAKAPKEQAALRAYLADQLIALELDGMPEADRVAVEDRVRAICKVPQ